MPRRSGALRFVILMATTLAVTACGESPPQASAASVTVKLPPAKPYSPAPSFSFGAAPRAAG